MPAILRLTAAAAALLLAACVSRSGYQQQVEGYMGASIDSVVMDLGPPDSSFQLADGSTVYEWEELSIERRPRLFQTWSSQYYVHTQTGQVIPLQRPSQLGEDVSEITRICTTRFTTDPAGRVVKVEFEGDGCRA
ncbi:MAG: hypothetical protein R3F55_14730 [Alphaproteobacteria bacterium]